MTLTLSLPAGAVTHLVSDRNHACGQGILSDVIMKTSTTIKVDGAPKGVFMFQSVRPEWPYWAVSNREPATQWFKERADAEHFARTGEKRGIRGNN